MSLYKDAMNRIKLDEDKKQKLIDLYDEIRLKEDRLEENKAEGIKTATPLRARNRRYSKNNLMKTTAIIAVATACVIGVINVPTFINTTLQNSVAKNNNPFTINLMAAELQPGKEVKLVPEATIDTINHNKAQTDIEIDEYIGEWAMGYGSSDTDGIKHAYYAIPFPIKITGDNINSIEYKINTGVFQVEIINGENNIVGQAIDSQQELNIPLCSSVYNMPNNEVVQYKEFTVKYDEQLNDKYNINIGNRKVVKGGNIICNTNDSNINEAKEKQNELIDNAVVTCIINFNDGSTEKVEIEIKGVIEDALDPCDNHTKELGFALKRR